MIISRTTFTLKFGQAKAAIARWKEIMDSTAGHEHARPMRLLSDLSGPNYTLVLEVHLRGFTDIGPNQHVWMTHPRIREVYPQIVPLCESAVSQLYHVEHAVGPKLVAGQVVEQVAFQLAFGKAQPACAIWKRILEAMKDGRYPLRLYTDLTGPSYMLYLDSSYGNVQEYGQFKYQWMTNELVRKEYQEFIPLCLSSERTLLAVQHMT